MNTSGEIRDDDTTIINTLTEQNSTGFNPQRPWPGGQTNITTPQLHIPTHYMLTSFHLNMVRRLTLKYLHTSNYPLSSDELETPRFYATRPWTKPNVTHAAKE